MSKEKEVKVFCYFNEAGHTIQEQIEDNFLIYFNEELEKIRKDNELYL